MSTENVSLVKGEKVDLTKTNPGLKTLVAGLGWEENAGTSGDFDLDAFLIVLRGGKYVDKKDLLYFGLAPSMGAPFDILGGIIRHTGDNLTGKGAGDDEKIEIDLDRLPDDVDQMIVALSIYQAKERRQRFSMVTDSYVRMVDKDTQAELQRYDLAEDYGSFTAVVFGKIYRHNGEWKFEAIGKGCNGDINDIANEYR